MQPVEPTKLTPIVLDPSDGRPWAWEDQDGNITLRGARVTDPVTLAELSARPGFDPTRPAIKVPEWVMEAIVRHQLRKGEE